MDATRPYPVPLDLRRDEHALNLLGFIPVTFRQVGYILAGIAPGAMAVWGLDGPVQWVVGAVLLMLFFPIAFVLAVFPAGWGFLPGPKDRYSTVQEQPLRLDEWIVIWLGWRMSTKVLPFHWGGRR